MAPNQHPKARRTVAPDGAARPEGGVDMATFILTWNPSVFPALLDDWESEAAQIETLGYLDSNWAVGSRKTGITPGDTVYFLRQSSERGLLRRGYVTSEIRLEPHWDPELAAAGRTASFVDVRWVEQVDLADRLTTEELLERIPQVPWNNLMQSGARVDPSAETTLHQLWEDHLRHIGSVASGLFSADTSETEETGHSEGRVAYRMHRTRERSPALRAEKIAQVQATHGRLLCEACGHDFAHLGAVGQKIFECHHLVPLHQSGPTITSLEDVALLCPTCHRVAHRLDAWPTLEELAALVRLA